MVSENEIKNLCSKTLKQSDCPDWFAIRQTRISASSKAHSIKTLKTKSISSLIEDFLHPKNVKTPATMYGCKFEKVALSSYEKLFNVSVKKVGALISKFQPWLIVSLDGVVVEDGVITKIVEFKCPFSCKKLPIVHEKDKKINVSCLTYVNGVVELKKSDKYYTQCQLQMYVSGTTECDLYIWSPVSSFLISVHRDEIFLQEILPKLEAFYFKYYLLSLLPRED